MTVNNLEESRIDEESLLEMDDREDKEEIEMKKAINDFIMINNKLNKLENEEENKNIIIVNNNNNDNLNDDFNENKNNEEIIIKDGSGFMFSSIKKFIIIM